MTEIAFFSERKEYVCKCWYSRTFGTIIFLHWNFQQCIPDQGYDLVFAFSRSKATNMWQRMHHIFVAVVAVMPILHQCFASVYLHTLVNCNVNPGMFVQFTKLAARNMPKGLVASELMLSDWLVLLCSVQFVKVKLKSTRLWWSIHLWRNQTCSELEVGLTYSVLLG